MEPAVAVLDIGKTASKLALFAPDGRRLASVQRLNERDVDAGLDVAGIEAWLWQALRNAAGQYSIEAIVPVGHGAAAVLVDRGAPVAALDYEAEIPHDVEGAYAAERDPFADTLSPRLAGGLNLGVQLFRLEQLHPDIWPSRGRLMLWPQFWAWRLCGVHASEVSSLGCHTDLWRPRERRFSDLAIRRGWAAGLGPRRRADEVLAPIRPELAAEFGVPAVCRVHCGVHDSNAALLSARAHPELGEAFTLVSTGTWFVCARSGGANFDRYDPAKDMLAGVDVAGVATPMARFMGGRDYETALGAALGAAYDPARLAEAENSAAGGADPVLAATRAAVDLARRTSRCLDLLDADGPIVIEGRFSADQAMTAALAALRPDQPIYVTGDDAAFGGLLLARPDAKPAPSERIVSVDLLRRRERRPPP